MPFKELGLGLRCLLGDGGFLDARGECIDGGVLRNEGGEMMIGITGIQE